MQHTPNYNLTIAEGTDAVNPLTQIFPNFTSIDAAMEDNKEHGITTASEVTTGGVHAIVRVDSSVPVFRFTATSAWTGGDTMTLDGSAVTVHLADGTAPKSGAYVIGAEVLAIVNGSLVTLMTGASFDGVVSFNSRQGVVTPQSGDYTANMIGYNNTASGLSAVDTQSAIDELAEKGVTLLYTNSAPASLFNAQPLNVDPEHKYSGYIIDFGLYVGTTLYHTEFLKIDNGDAALATYFDVTGSGLVYSEIRRLSAADGVITFGDNNRSTINTYGSAPTVITANNSNIPFKIYGID